MVKRPLPDSQELDRERRARWVRWVAWIGTLILVILLVTYFLLVRN